MSLPDAPPPAAASPARETEVWALLKGRSVVLQDLPRWKRELNEGALDDEAAFLKYWAKRQEFRSVIEYRVKRLGDGELLRAFRILCAGKPWFFVTNLYLSCEDIGPGLYIEHGFSTIVYARRIGANFRINQNVTVGTNKGGNPVIGDDVSIYTGAVVVGGITIGDQVRVGANAVVLEDIPSRATVVPAKSRIILRD